MIVQSRPESLDIVHTFSLSSVRFMSFYDVADRHSDTILNVASGVLTDHCQYSELEDACMRVQAEHA